MSEKIKRIAILGSTGSIGTQALDVIKANPQHFSAEVLAAHSNADLLIKQALEFDPNAVVIVDESKYLLVKEALKNTSIISSERVLTGDLQMRHIFIEIC